MPCQNAFSNPKDRQPELLYAMGNAMAQPLIGRSLLQLPVTRGGTRGQPSDMELKQADSIPEDYSFGPKLKNHGSVDNQMWQLQRSVLKSWKTKDSTYIEVLDTCIYLAAIACYQRVRKVRQRFWSASRCIVCFGEYPQRFSET